MSTQQHKAYAINRIDSSWLTEGEEILLCNQQRLRCLYQLNRTDTPSRQMLVHDALNNKPLLAHEQLVS